MFLSIPLQFLCKFNNAKNYTLLVTLIVVTLVTVTGGVSDSDSSFIYSSDSYIKQLIDYHVCKLILVILLKTESEKKFRYSNIPTTILNLSRLKGYS